MNSVCEVCKTPPKKDDHGYYGHAGCWLCTWLEFTSLKLWDQFMAAFRDHMKAKIKEAANAKET